MSEHPPNAAIETDGESRWLSPSSSGANSSWSEVGNATGSNGPDFEAIPRDKSGARAAAVLALYESDLTNRPASQCFDWIAAEIRLSRKLRTFAIALVREAEINRGRLDSTLNRYSHRSTMDETLPAIRNILRIALVEMDLHPETRTAIIISEAVKLSQTFDTTNAGKYVNGVLGAFARDSNR